MSKTLFWIWLRRVGLAITAGVVPAFLIASAALAAAGDLDPTFGDAGTLLAYRAGGTSTFCCRVAAYPGGKIVALAHTADSPTVAVIRLNADGSLDRSFNATGVATLTFEGDVNNQADLGAIAVDPSGHVVVSESISVSGNRTAVIARLTAAGQLDGAFGHGGIVQSTLGFTDAEPNGIAVLTDASVVVGALVTDGGAQKLDAARFESDGTRDAGFGAPFAISGSASAPLLAVDGDGRFLLAGEQTALTHIGSSQYIARLDAGGRLDTTFGASGVVLDSLGSSATATAIAAAADGRPLVASLRFPNGSAQPVIDRYTAAGALDSTFGNGGVASLSGLTGTVLALTAAADGSWLFGGTQDASLLVGRLTAAGQPDTGFSATGTVTTPIAGSTFGAVDGVVVAAGGRILAVGEAGDNTSDYLAAARYLGSAVLAGGGGYGGGGSGGGSGGGGSGGGPIAHGAASFTLPSSTRAGSPVTFNGSASYASGALIRHYQWYLNGKPSAVCDGNTSQLQTRFLNPGRYTVKLRVTDLSGTVTTVSHSITISGVRRVRAQAAGVPSGLRAVLQTTNQVFACGSVAGDPTASAVSPGLPRCTTHVAGAIMDVEGCLNAYSEQIHVAVNVVADQPKLVFFSRVDTTQPLKGDPLPQSERQTLLSDIEDRFGSNPFAWICKYGSAQLKYEWCEFHPALGSRAGTARTPGGLPTSTNSTGNIALTSPCSVGLPDEVGIYEEPLCFDLYVSSGPIKINGLEYRPAPGDVIAVVPELNLVISTSAAVYLGPARLHDFEAINHLLPEQSLGPTLDYPLLDVPDIRALLRGQPQDAQDELGSVGGIPTTGDAHIAFGDFTSEVTLHVALPGVFTDDNGGPVSVEVRGELSNTNGFRVIYGRLGGIDGGTTVDLGPIQLRHFGVCFRAHASSDPGVDPCPGATGIPEDPSFGDDFWDASGEVDVGPWKLVFRGRPPSGCGSVGRLGIGFGGVGFRFAGAGLETPGVDLGGVTLDSIYAGLENTSGYGRFGGCANFSAGYGLVSLTGSLFALWTKDGVRYQFDGSELPGLVKSGDPPSFPYTDDVAIGAGGALGINLPVLGRINVGNAYLLYVDDPAAVFLGGGFNFSVPSGSTFENPPDNGFAIGGGIYGAIGLRKPPAFYLEGEVNAVANITPLIVTIPVFHGTAGAAIADDPRTGAGGIGICGQLDVYGVDVTAGIGYHWGDDVFDVLWNGLHVGSCDFLASFRIDVQSARLASGPPRPAATVIHVPRGAPATDLYLRAAQGAPDVTITGPGGVHASTSGIADDRGVVSGPFVLIRVPQINRTYIAIRHPAPGEYRIAANPGSPAIAALRQANAIRPQVQARVSGRGRRRLLAYRLKPQPGQSVMFAERDGGQLTQVLGRARGTRGTIAFAARVGRRRRQVVAEIAERGVPVQAIAVARYSPPRPRHLGRVRRLHVRRAGTTATVSYAAVPGAKAYVLSVAMRDGARLLLRTTRRRVVIHGLFLEVAGRVTVRPQGDGVNTLSGLATRAELPAAIR